MQNLSVIASAWRWNLPGLLCAGVLLAVYGCLNGFRHSRSLAFFLAADAFFVLVVCSPLDLLAHQYLLTAEAVEQMGIGLVASYLLVLGVPRSAVRLLRLDRLRVSYYLAWATGMAAFSMWYVPRLLSATSRDGLRCLEYATLLLGGTVFWWPLHSPSREHRIPLVPHSLLYLAAATVWCSLTGLFVAFGPSLPSAHYFKAADTLHIADSLVSDWGFTPETDRETAGLIYWICAATILLTEVLLVYYRWYTSPEVRNEFTVQSFGGHPKPANQIAETGH
jgi:cytochrome c oxidase assembly factor CtaG